MGCSSSKAAAGEAPDVLKKGPTQEEMLRANSPAVAPASPPPAPVDPVQARTTSVLPIMPALTADDDAPRPPTASSPQHARNPSTPKGALPLQTSQPLSPRGLRASPAQLLVGSATMTPQTSASLPLPTQNPNISKSLPMPLPPVKPGHSRPLSVTVLPKPDSIPGTPGASPGSTMTNETVARWRATGQLEGSPEGGSLKTSPKGSAPLSRQQSFNSLLATAVPSLNLSDPAYTSTRLGETFTHYARKRFEGGNKTLGRSASKTSEEQPSHRAEKAAGDEETVDKKALGQLATDCVLSFLLCLRLDPALKTAKDEKLRDKKERELRVKFIPGSTLEECVEFARFYLATELQVKHGHATRTMFFYHFPRAYKALFTHEKLTVEREALVQKWNTAGQVRLAEKKKPKEKHRDKKDKDDSESEAHSREGSRKGGRHSHGEKKKRRKDRATAPANSINDLMQSTNSKVMQAEKKLTSTISAASNSNEPSKYKTMRKVKVDRDDDSD